MELWIRSQDKEALAKFDLCILEKYEDKYMFIADHYKNMGTYKSKERALEVLDEIQKILIPNAKLISNKDFEGNDVKVYGVEYIDSYVYEMPKE